MHVGRRILKRQRHEAPETAPESSGEQPLRDPRTDAAEVVRDEGVLTDRKMLFSRLSSKAVVIPSLGIAGGASILGTNALVGGGVEPVTSHALSNAPIVQSMPPR